MLDSRIHTHGDLPQCPPETRKYMVRVSEFLIQGGWLESAAGPRYKPLQRRIEEGISSDHFPPDAPLPAERGNAAQAGFSRATVPKAMSALAERGAIIQRQGSGSFAAEAALRVEQSRSRLTSCSEDMPRRGLETESVWLERGLFVPSPEEVFALSLRPEDSVARISRMRSAGGRPMAVEHASLPPDLLPDPTYVTRSLYEVPGRNSNRSQTGLAENFSHQPQRRRCRASGGHTRSGRAKKTERTSYFPGGRVAEFTRSVYHEDTYNFVAELRLAENRT